jgi:type I restriction-modification system DNA methylase subunit
MNERKTEILVRNHFSQFSNVANAAITVEEQQSDSPKINKLLKNASKKGTGQGYPEFIITYKTNPDFLIVIECKADMAKHESKDRSQYAEYAVDGVLLYASYLSKEYDVLAIAVSGKTKRNLKISHFLHLKNEKKAVVIFDDKFLSSEEYLNAYLKSPEKFKQDYNKLLDFTKKLNEKLHGYKILESQRGLLISSILIALENPAFKRSYTSHKKPENLATSLVQTVSDELEGANILGRKLENLNIQFSFIKTDTSLSKKENVLKEIIDQIDENINSFIKTYKYFDVLGQLYIEFLRYANSDKGLGIVLTPPHITEFFSDLAQVNKNSVVYDNCAGTGGFLISAMKLMIADAKGDTIKEKAIKTSQLIGVEYQSHIFALAVSNMYIHQDGKTNIINSSCFDDDVIELVKAKKPTVGFLNPPYKANKKTDTDEMAFVLNNLECLVDGGTCIAIVPISAVLAKTGKPVELKKKLMQKHTLEAVMSMPEDLFHNSKVAPVPVIIVITAHKPHQSEKKVWLADFREDNFAITKDRGRIDVLGTWEAIKNNWVALYSNKGQQHGTSLVQKLSPRDEWCIEAYLPIDYDKITKTQFKQKIQNFLAFRLLYGLYDIQLDKTNRKNLEKNLVRLDSIFDVYNGLASSEVEVIDDYVENAVRYIRPSQTYQGSIAGYVDTTFIEDKFIFSENTLYVSTDGQGSHTYSYVSSFEFVPNSNVCVLMPKETMSLAEKLYYALCVTANRCKFSYGRKPKGERLKAILLPAVLPDFVYENIFEEIFTDWRSIIG